MARDDSSERVEPSLFGLWMGITAEEWDALDAAPAEEEKRGPLGDARPDATENDTRTPAASRRRSPRIVRTSAVKPEDYPDRA